MTKQEIIDAIYVLTELLKHFDSFENGYGREVLEIRAYILNSLKSLTKALSY